MAKVKTEKYYINTYLSDSIVHTKLEVNRRVFDKQFKETLRQYQQQESGDEFHVDMDTYLTEYHTYIIKRVVFSYGICSIDYVTMTCKEGYHFK